MAASTARVAIVLRMALLIAGLSAATSVPAQDEERTPTDFGAAVEVKRIITEVRVVHHDGSPVLGLGPEDFKVKIGGERAEVRSVLWIPSTAEAAKEATDHPSSPHHPVEPEGRLIVALFQVDPMLRMSRTLGLVRMTPRVSKFVSGLGPDDQVAVLVFDSHLEVLSDFTDDHEVIADALHVQKLLRRRPAGVEPTSPSFTDHFDFEEATGAASMADALELIGEALQPIPGTKLLVLFGYSLHDISENQTIRDDDYRSAMRALSKARTSVFSLGGGSSMRLIAEDTGGFFIETSLFPDMAMKKLVRVISSFYELEIIPPPDLGDEYTIKVSVDRPRTDIYIRQDHPSQTVW